MGCSQNRANRKKHDLGFDEAQELFTSGVDYLELYDEAHSEQEERFIAIGPIHRGVVVSVRSATRRERELYQKHIGEKP